jgi:hypothetical protein
MCISYSGDFAGLILCLFIFGGFMAWFYLISGGLALYSVETAAADQPLYITAMQALLLCVIPSTLDGLAAQRIPVMQRILRRKQCS